VPDTSPPLCVFFCSTGLFAAFLNGPSGDEFEVVVKLRYLENATLEFNVGKESNTQWKKLPTQRLLFRKYYKQPLGNLFCMSALRVNPTDEPAVYRIDERLKGFGSHYLLIYNSEIFLEKMRQALDALDFVYYYQMVNYLDLHTYTGEKTIFQKDISYSYQEEFRIFLDTPYSEAFKFTIGNIEDISSIYEFSKVPSFLTQGLPAEQGE
jgi:hypothetical protein